MSEIKNGGLDQYGAEPFERQQFGTAGVEGVKLTGAISGIVEVGAEAARLVRLSPLHGRAVVVVGVGEMIMNVHPGQH